MSKQEPTSEEFWDAVISAGSIVISCEFCDRVHFVSEGAYDEGELEELREKAKKNPNKYIENGITDSIRWGHIDGKQAVYDCPCNGAKRFEDLIWHHRDMIVQYLTTRMEDRLKRAKDEVTSIKKLEKMKE